jgi:protein SCO1/2
MQRKLGSDSEKVLMISVSIDPEYDTPEVMTEYLARYRAKPGWMFLTGTREDANKVMRAFDAYVQDKMSHYPLTLLKAPGSDRWVRIYGLIGTADLMDEYRKLLDN